MLEQILFWPVSEFMRLQHTFQAIDSPKGIQKDDRFGYFIGIAITLGMIIIGTITGIVAPLSILLLLAWIYLYIIGVLIEYLFLNLHLYATWWIRLFLDGFVFGYTLRILFLQG